MTLFIASRTLLDNSVPRTAAHSSSRGRETTFNGATLDLEHSKLTLIWPIEFTDLKYIQVPNAFRFV